MHFWLFIDLDLVLFFAVVAVHMIYVPLSYRLWVKLSTFPSPHLTQCTLFMDGIAIQFALKPDMAPMFYFLPRENELLIH